MRGCGGSVRRAGKGQELMRWSSGVRGRTSVAVVVLVASFVVPATTSRSSVDAAGWQGFAVSQLVSGVSGGTSPSWGLGITEDLGGPGIDVWNNNHGDMSEAIIDLVGEPTTTTVEPRWAV